MRRLQEVAFRSMKEWPATLVRWLAGSENWVA